MDFKINDRVYSMYDDGIGRIVLILSDLHPEIYTGQAFYLVQWDNGKLEQVAREEIY